MTMLKLRRRPEPAMPMPERDRRLVWRISALLLDYPGADLLAAIDEISCAVTELPDEVRVHLTEFVAYLRATVSLDLTARYVETFDLRRRASLHLTFFARTRYARRQLTRSGFRLAISLPPDSQAAVSSASH
jgi:nitrate reductase delta subunit